MKKHILCFGLALAFSSPIAGMAEEVSGMAEAAFCLHEEVSPSLLKYLQTPQLGGGGSYFGGRKGKHALEYLLKKNESYVEGLSTEVAQEVYKLLHAGVVKYREDYARVSKCLRFMHVLLEKTPSSSSSSTDLKINVSGLLWEIYSLFTNTSSQRIDCVKTSDGNRLRGEAGYLIKCLSDKELLRKTEHANKLVIIYCNCLQKGCKKASSHARGSLNLVLQEHPWFVAAVLACRSAQAKKRIQEKIDKGELDDPGAGSCAGAGAGAGAA